MVTGCPDSLLPGKKSPKASQKDEESLQAEIDREIVANVVYSLKARPELVTAVCARSGMSLIQNG